MLVFFPCVFGAVVSLCLEQCLCLCFECLCLCVEEEAAEVEVEVEGG